MATDFGGPDLGPTTAALGVDLVGERRVGRQQPGPAVSASWSMTGGPAGTVDPVAAVSRLESFKNNNKNMK